MRAILLVLLAAILGATTWMLWQEPKRAATSTGEAAIGGDFELMNGAGRKVTQADFAGKPMLVYFGYSFCPDICPTTLMVMSQAAQGLAGEEVTPVFITLDPERDTVAQMKEFVANFPGVVGLTGSTEQIKQAAQAYRIYYKKNEAEKGGDYLIDHTSLIYLMGPDGRYLAHFPHTISTNELKTGIQSALHSNQTGTTP